VLTSEKVANGKQRGISIPYTSPVFIVAVALLINIPASRFISHGIILKSCFNR